MSSGWRVNPKSKAHPVFPRNPAKFLILHYIYDKKKMFLSKITKAKYPRNVDVIIYSRE